MEIRLKLIGDQTLVDELKKLEAETPGELKIVSESAESDPTKQGFDLQTVSAVVTLVTGGLYGTKLAARLLLALTNGRAGLIVAQTPVRTGRLSKAIHKTEESVRSVLESLVKNL